MLIMSLLVIAGIFAHIFDSIVVEIKDWKRRKELRKAIRKKRRTLRQC